jgi:hypothetical protein
VLVRLRFKLATLSALSGSLADAKAEFDKAVQTSDELREAGTATAGRIVRARSSRFDVTRELATACLDWNSPEAARREDGVRRIVAQFSANELEFTRDELLLLMFVGEKFLKGGEPDEADARRKVATAIYYRLANVRPRGKIVGAAEVVNYKPPPLLESYRELAKQYLGGPGGNV